MRIMTRVGIEVMRQLARGAPFVKCMHSVGLPLGEEERSTVWPCNPDNVMIAHKPDTMEIIRYKAIIYSLYSCMIVSIYLV